MNKNIYNINFFQNSKLLLLSILCGYFSISTANSTSLYTASLNNRDATAGDFYTQAGHNGANSSAYVGGISSTGINQYGVANAAGTQINLSGQTTSNSGITIAPGAVSRGSIAIGDFIFTDINNPANTGPIEVSANLFNGLSTIITGTHFATFSGTSVFTSATFYGQVGLTEFPTSVATSNLFSGTLDGSSFTTSTISVSLNTSYTLFFSGSLDYLSNINTDAYFQASLGLNANPFNLPENFTVNSYDAGVVNNSLSAVPIPAAIWLFGSGLLGLAATGYRKKKH